MKNFMVIFLGLFFIQFSFAQDNWKYITIATSEKINVSTYFVKNAEYVTAELSINNDDSDPIKRYKLLNKAIEGLNDIVKDKEYVTIKLLPVKLTTVRSKLVSSFMLDTVLKYRILVLLSYFNNDFLEATSQLRKVIDSLPKIEDTDYNLSTAELAMENPERYRQDIINLVEKDVNQMKQTFGESINIEIDGLENPVQAVQLDEIKIALLIDYNMKIKM